MPLISGRNLAKALARKELERNKALGPTSAIDKSLQESLHEAAANVGLHEAWRRYTIGRDNAEFLCGAQKDLDKILPKTAAWSRDEYYRRLSLERRKNLFDAARVLSEISGSSWPLFVVMGLCLNGDMHKAIMRHLVPSDAMSVKYKPSWKLIIENLAEVHVQEDTMCVTTHKISHRHDTSKTCKIVQTNFYDCSQGLPLSHEKQQLLRERLNHVQSMAMSLPGRQDEHYIDQSYLNISEGPILYLSNGDAVFFKRPEPPLHASGYISVWDWRNGKEKTTFDPSPYVRDPVSSEALIEGFSHSIICPKRGKFFNCDGSLRLRFPNDVALWQNQNACMELENYCIAHNTYFYNELPCTAIFMKNKAVDEVKYIPTVNNITEERIFKIDNNKALFIPTKLMCAPKKTKVRIIDLSVENNPQTSHISVKGNAWYALQLPNHLWGMLVTTDTRKEPERYVFVIVNKNNVVQQTIPLYHSYLDAPVGSTKKHGDLLCAAQVNNGQVIISLKPRNGQPFVSSFVPRPFKTVAEMLKLTQIFGTTKESNEGIIGKLLEYATL